MSRSIKGSRRAFLGTAGTMLALPWLEIMANTREARAANPAFPVRFITFYIPIGVCPAGWNPSGTETTWSLGTTIDSSDPDLYAMSPLKAFQKDVNVITGVTNTQGIADDGHVANESCVLTAAQITRSTTGQDTSADQYIADYWAAQPSRPNLRSLELGTYQLTNYPDGFNPIMTGHMSWSHGTPLPKIVDPQQAFDRVFAGFDPSATAADVAKRKAYNQSVIDTVRAQSTRLQARLGAHDKAKLDQYLTGIRELELRVQTGVGQGCGAATRPGKPADQRALVTQMLDITALAVQCDITRVVSFSYEHTVTEVTHPWATGTNAGYHIGITHCGDNPVGCTTAGTPFGKPYVQVNRWLIEQYAYLLGKLKAMPEGTGTVLDNSFVYLTSEFGDGGNHRPENIPQIIAGSGGGTVQTGRLLKRDGALNGDVLLAMMKKIGLSSTKLGVCSNPISL